MKSIRHNEAENTVRLENDTPLPQSGEGDILIKVNTRDIVCKFIPFLLLIWSLLKEFKFEYELYWLDLGVWFKLFERGSKAMCV